MGRKAAGRDHGDLLSEAIRHTLDPDKRRWNRSVSFTQHLIGAMRSISSHWAGERGAADIVWESEFTRAANDGTTINTFDRMASDAPNGERIAEAKQQFEQIQQSVADDSVLAAIVDAMRADTPPPMIRDSLGLSRTEYETALKRLRRRVRAPIVRRAYDA